MSAPEQHSEFKLYGRILLLVETIFISHPTEAARALPEKLAAVTRRWRCPQALSIPRAPATPTASQRLSLRH